MQHQEKILNVLTVAAVLGALAVATARLMPGAARTNVLVQADRAIPGFDELASSPLRLGPARATLTIVEFGDFQCPSCARFATVIDTLLGRHPGEVAFVWRHFPLPGHSLAYPLARGAECAASEGRFKEFYHAALRYQANLGLITVADLGLKAMPRDSGAFLRCLTDSMPVPSIERDIAVAESLGIMATPTIIVNGTLYGRGSSLKVADFESMLKKR